MARVTVEDCLEHVENRFELVLLAAKRARQIVTGRANPEVPWEDDKSTVVALREIAAGKINKTLVDSIDNQNRTLSAAELLQEAAESDQPSAV